MIALSCVLAALLVLETSTPATIAADCQITDKRCKAQRSERRAAASASAEQRALYLLSAYRSYAFLFDEAGDMRDLCAARRVLDASLAVEGQSTAQRASAEAAQAELVARERKTGARCSRLPKPRRVQKPAPPPPLALKTTDPPAPTGDGATIADVGDAVPALLTSGPITTTSSVELEPRTRAQPDPAVALMPIPTPRTPPIPRDHAPRPGRRLVIAGGITLGVGVALTAAAGYMGRRMVATRQAYFDLHDSVEGVATTDQETMGDHLLQEYRAMWPQTLALAVAGGTTIIVAAVLAGVGGRRLARTATRTALVPVPGGLALHARF